LFFNNLLTLGIIWTGYLDIDPAAKYLNLNDENSRKRRNDD